MILVGERLATVARRAHRRRRAGRARTGARLAWVPRRAGDRGAVETGCLPNLLPGGRPVADAAARVDAATAWGVDAPARDAPAATPTRSSPALAAGELGGLVVGGVDPDDTADPAAFRAALDGGVVRGRPRAARDRRDPRRRRGLPGRPGHRQGRHVRHLGGPARARSRRSSPTPRSLPDLRVLAGIAEELGTARSGFRTVAEARAADGGDGSVGRRARRPRRRPTATGHDVSDAPASPLLATWKQLIDNGSMQDGDDSTCAPPPGRRSAAAQPAVLRRARARCVTAHR